jgi:hypothetical protein
MHTRFHPAVLMNSDFEELLRIFKPNEVENAGKVWASLTQIGQPPVRVDILMSIDGVKFKEAWPIRRQSHLGAQTAWFIGREDLLKNKRTTSRHTDLGYAA